MTDERDPAGLSDEELSGQGATALPDKEVVSILDLNADLNLAIDTAAPIDLAAAANANVAAPIDAAVGTNILSVGSDAQALADQGAVIHQGVSADATATAGQNSDLAQGAGATTDGSVPADPAATGATGAGVPDPAGAVGDPAGAVGDAAGTASGAASGDLLNVDVNLDANADIAAPINGAVAANANVAAPIDAAVGANVGSVDSHAVAVSQQDVQINQNIDGSADANSDQTSDIQQ
jgi:hypothetical protein